MSLFDALRFTGRRPPSIGDTEREVVSTRDLLRGALGDWAGKAPPEFGKFLDNLIIEADLDEAEAIDSHVRMAHARGRRDALAALRAHFNDWRDSDAL